MGIRGVDAPLRAPVDVRVDGAALDRPGADERHLDGEVVHVLGTRAQEALHLRAALDLERADGVRRLDLPVDALVVERDAREVDRLAARERDPLDAVLDGGEHPEPEQVDLQEARVGARVLVPLAELASLHRRRHHGHELDERPRRDDHPARVLGEMARQPGDLLAEPAERPPAARGELRLRVGERRQLLFDETRIAVRDAREPLQLREGQAERLADVADRAAGVVRGERRHERRVLAPVALGHLHDQPLADVAREVEVDVGDGGELPVEEAAEREAGGDGIDVREPGEVADDRAHRGAAATAGRQGVSGRARAAQVERDLARQLEHLEVEEEEAGQLEIGDEPQLLLQALAGASLVAVRARVALGERPLADAAQLRVRRLLAVREVGIAVAELLGEVELEPSGELGRAGDGVRVVRESGRPCSAGRSEHALAVAAPLALGAVERRAMADGDERVLEHGAAMAVRVHVAGGHRFDAERLGELAQRGVAAGVAALVRALELDEEALAAERGGEPGGGVGIADGKAVAGTAGQADEAVVPHRELFERQRRLEPVVRVREGEQPAEVRVAPRRLDKQRDMGAALERHLRAGDRPHAEGLRRVRELERAVDAVVVGERERLVAELGGPDHELLGLRRPVEERIG